MCLIRFFFFKQKTAYEMRISDWSSDVCSSDLGVVRQRPAHDLARMHLGAVDRAAEQLLERQRPVAGVEEQRGEDLAGVAAQALGEVAAGRGRVGQDRKSTRLNSSH